MAFQKSDSKEGSFKRRPMRNHKKVCAFCAKAEGITVISYKDAKDPSNFRKYVSETGKILPRRATGVCAIHQRALTTAVKRARHLALLPYAVK